MEEERRRRYGPDDYRLSTPTTAPISTDEPHSVSPTQQEQQQQQQQQGRKSLSTLHKERKLKELSESSNLSTEPPPLVPPSTKADILRQQAFQSVLTDILSGNSNGSGNSPSVRPVEIISPESGYNSSASLKSPLSGNQTQLSTSHNQNRLNQQPNQSISTAAKPNELELRASRERILEQVRIRRASAPPVQHLGPISSDRSSNISPQPRGIGGVGGDHQQRPLKSILKKRQPDNQFSRSVDNGIYQSQKFQLRSSSYSDEGDSKRSSVMSNLTDENTKHGDYSLGESDSQNVDKRISLTETSRPQSSPVPLMAERPGPSELISNPDSPGPYVHHVDYPSPVRNGGSTSTSQGKRGDLPDVVVLKIGSNGNQLRSPQTSFDEQEKLTATPKSFQQQQQHQQSLEKPKSLERKSLSHESESTTGSNSEYDAFREWDPRPLLRQLYTVDYEARSEPKRQRFVNMEGHLEHLPMNMRAVVASDTLWRTHYFRTKEGRLQWFEDTSADSIPFGELMLAGAEVDLDKNACIFVVHNAKESQLLTIRYQPHLLDKWRSALLSHASSSSSLNYVKPVYPAIPHADENVCVIELGSCSIRAGLLTSEPSLPQTYFPSIACVLPDGTIVPGFDALSPSVRHEGAIVHPITPTQPAVNRYSMDLETVKHLFRNVFQDLQIESQSYQIMLSVPQNAPVGLVGDLMRLLLADFGVKGVFVSRQPFLILYAYDVTTGVVVDFGDRLNIVPVIDGYVVQSAIVSLPYGGHNVADGLRTKLIERNWTPYSFMSEVEKYILRYVMEKTCYVAADFDDEAQRYKNSPSEIDTHVNIEQFEPTAEMPKGYDVDASRFTSPEGLFKPKRWGFDIDGLHKLIYHAIQGSPLDSRRVLYRNIYLAGGASLMPGLVERLESELAPLVASSVQVRVRTSPYRDHAAYIGAQILAGGIQFEQQLIKDTEELDKFIRRLYSANF